MMAATHKPGVFGMALGLLLLCVSASASPQTGGLEFAVPAVRELPADIAMNPDAGRGGLLFVTVRLDDGEELPFVVDTGCPTTCLDASLEPKLGKRIRTETLWAFGVKSKINVYRAPQLYLGNTPLVKTGPLIVTHDCSAMSRSVGRPIMGILGIDILQHYCVQLDFADDKVRFLDDQHADPSGWGRAFSLFYLADGCYCISENLTGTPGAYSLIDTGCNYDGWLTPRLYRQWTNRATPPMPGLVRAPNGVLAGQIYTNLDLHGVDPRLLTSGDTHIKFNGIGLQFLGRHLVTFDFPQQTVYLRRADVQTVSHEDIKEDVRAAEQVIKDLEARGKLPGWTNGESMAASHIQFSFDYPCSVTFAIRKVGDLSSFHYKVSRASKDSPWNLLKAWHADAGGQTLEDYPVQ